MTGTLPMANGVLIVGQGLAGTALAWQLLWRGVPFRVVDRDEPATASRVAAGLLTPVTGKRLAASWRYDELFPAAAAFYRRVEAETGTRLFFPKSIVRLFQSADEAKRFEKKRGEFGPHVRDVPPGDGPIRSPLGGFEMTAAAQLRVPDYLRASRAAFGDRFRVADVTEVEPQGEVVVYCQGFAGFADARFRRLTTSPAKGEILTLRVPGLSEDRVVNRGVWLARLDGDLYQAGATYDRDRLDHEPTAKGREYVCGKLREFLTLPFEVVDHRAAVRPILAGRKLLAGFLPDEPRVGFFNGLSSKGALWAPHFAGQFADSLAGRGTIDPEVDLAGAW